jgi:PAS domain S-box-containing protein
MGGEIGRIMAERDWSASPLGAPETWPQSLRSVVGLLLGSKFPMFVAWGAELVILYNDAYAEILGAKHPDALGALFHDIWPEIWPDISPLIDAALAGEATYSEDLPLVLNRRGYDEQAWFTFSYSPVHDEGGRIAGMFCAVAETTGKVLAEQRQNFTVSLGDTLAKLTDTTALTAAAAELLGQHLKVGRAGYGEIDASGEVVSVERDWSDTEMASLAGEARVLDAFGPEVIAQLRAGRALVVSDCLEDPRTSRPEYLVTWEGIGTRALVVVPLLGAGRLVAFLYVHSAGPRKWSDLEVRLVEDAGARTWAAVERARAEASLRESEAALAAEVEALGRLQEVSTRLVVDETPQAIYDAILTAAADVMGSECASIQMLDAAGDLQLLAHRGYDPRSAAYWQTVDSSSGSTCGVALTTGERVVVHDVEDSGLVSDSGDLQSYRWTGMRAVQTTPLLSRSGKPLGMLSTHWKRPHTPSRRDYKLFDVLARQAADAIERTTAQAELRESEGRQAFLLSLSDALRALRNPAEIASVAADRLGERFGLNRAFYAEFFGSLMKIERDFARGVESIVGEHELEAFGPDLLSAYHECPIVKVNDVRTDPRFSEEARAGLQARQVRSYLDVILFEEEQWVSLLALQSATPRAWTASEEGLFREVGERVRAAIERARAEDRLRELNETLERRVAEASADLDRVWRNASDIFVVIDVDGAFRRVNPATTAILGWAEGDMIGRNVFEFVHPDDVASTTRALEHARADVLPSFENRYRARDGRLRTIAWVAAPEGALIYAYGRDVTSEHERQAELAVAQEALRQAQKMEAMGQLTGGVAHDFNNLLTPIVGSLDMLQRKQLGGEREQRLIAGAMQSAERAKTLVQRLLAFARRQPLQPVPVDLAKLVNGMGDLIASTTGPQIKVIVEAPDGLPPAKADPNQLEMALLNLAVNARDAMEEGGGTLRISTRVEDVGAGHRTKLTPGTYLCLSVADTGAGMDEATIGRAVEPFFSTKGVGKGTGLGLSMVHGLASQLGGALAIRSRLGLGTNVELWLPHSPVPPDANMHAAGPPLLPDTCGTVLLVDDEELVRMSTADMLNDLGYAVIEAASAEAALRCMNDGERFDMLVTDHLMPGLSGTDLAREVRAVRPGMPVLLVSGYAEREGVDPDLPRLTKPFRKDELASSIAQLAPSRPQF